MEQDFMRVLAPGRIFFDYGPVSMVVTAIRNGREDTELCKEGFAIISACLNELRPALEELRKYPPQVRTERLSGTGLVMAQAVLKTGDLWLTPMAAVAGTISDAVADHLYQQGAEKVATSNGGDVALRLGSGEHLNLGICRDLSQKGVDLVVRLTPEKGIGGVATSGLGGRSFTTGIASGVTVFSRCCAEADALATLLADRSYLELPEVHTCLAGELDPDSDIADLNVVTHVDPLNEMQKRRSLDQVLAEAERQFRRGGLIACIATVQGMTCTYDPYSVLTD
jgi:ApbE superfamily uncharacterized protein (UPF0280 family)